jgi:hypothetical protein
MPLLIQMLVIMPLRLSIPFRRNNRLSFPYLLNQLIRIISFIPNYFGILSLPALYQFFPLSNIALFSASYSQFQRISQPIYTHMNLGAVSASASPQSLLPFFPAAQECARTMVESIMRCSKSGSSIKYLNIRSHTPKRLHRWNL